MAVSEQEHEHETVDATVIATVIATDPVTENVDVNDAQVCADIVTEKPQLSLN